MLCQDCSKKPTCQELCPEVEKIVNQDYVSRDKIVLLPDMDTFLTPEVDEDIWSYQKKKYTTEGLKYLIIKLHLEGKSQAEITYHLPCIHQYISTVIKKYSIDSKKKCNNNNNV